MDITVAEDDEVANQEFIKQVQQEHADWTYFHSQYMNAVKDLPVEWLHWFVQEIKGGATIPEAAWAATMEWDL